jgi:ribonuclease HI
MNSRNPIETKFYAVRRGKVPGIYTTWAECSKQVSGYRMNRFQSFDNRLDAEKFMRGRSYSKNSGIKQEEAGLDRKWGKMKERSSSQSPPRKKTRATSATSPTSAELIEAVEKTASSPPLSYAQAATGVCTRVPLPPTGKLKRKFKRPDMSKINFTPKRGEIYIDGSCLFNGLPTARAGIGVFFGSESKMNVAKRLQGTNQTSCRAELQACITALKVKPSKLVRADNCGFLELQVRMDTRNLIQQQWIDDYKHPTVYTDSQYLIDAEEQFMDNWIKTGRTNSNRIPKNLDLLTQLYGLTRDGNGKRIRNIKWVYVPSHSNDPGNDAADKLAKAGAKEDKDFFPTEDYEW